MIILGLYGCCGWTLEEGWLHGAGASLWRDSKHLGSISEERLSRLKHDGSYPAQSIDYLLNSNDLDHADVDFVVYVHNFHTFKKNNNISKILKGIFPKAEVDFVDHHQAHACAAFYTSPFKRAFILSIDGGGTVWGTNTESGLYAHGDDNRITVLYHAIHGLMDLMPLPLGGGFSYVARYIYGRKCPENCTGIQPEILFETVPGKVMGLSGYGKADAVVAPDIFLLAEDNFYFTRVIKNYPFRNDHLDSFSPEDIAAWLQDHFTNTLTKLFSSIPEEYRRPNLCFSGGCALNIIANRALKDLPEVDDLWVFPATNDAGLCFGGAISKVVNLFGRENLELGPNLASCGKSYSDEEITQAIQEVLTD